MPGTLRGDDPVATMISLPAVIWLVAPAASVTSIAPLPSSRADALDPLDLVLLEQHADAAGQALDDLVLAVLDDVHVEADRGRLAERDAPVLGRLAPPCRRGRARAAPWSGCSPSSGTCRRARCHAPRRRSSGPAARRESPPRSRQSLRRSPRHRMRSPTPAPLHVKVRARSPNAPVTVSPRLSMPGRDKAGPRRRKLSIMDRPCPARQPDERRRHRRAFEGKMAPHRWPLP